MYNYTVDVCGPMYTCIGDGAWVGRGPVLGGWWCCPLRLLASQRQGWPRCPGCHALTALTPAELHAFIPAELHAFTPAQVHAFLQLSSPIQIF